MKLEEWLRDKSASWHNKYLDDWMDLKVIHEIDRIGLEDNEWEDFMKLINIYFPKHRNIYSFITLENGWAIGFNENASHGWSFPRSIKKYHIIK